MAATLYSKRGKKKGGGGTQELAMLFVSQSWFILFIFPLCICWLINHNAKWLAVASFTTINQGSHPFPYSTSCLYCLLWCEQQPWRELEGTVQRMLLLMSLKGTVHENTLIQQETKDWRFYHLSFKWWMNILSYFCSTWTVRAGEGCSEELPQWNHHSWKMTVVLSFIHINGA